MQDWPLTVDRFLVHANRYHGHRQVVSQRDNGETESTTYAQIYKDARRISNALTACGVGKGSIDFKPIFAHAPGIEHYFVESDSAADPMVFAANSYTYLRNLTF